MAIGRKVAFSDKNLINQQLIIVAMQDASCRDRIHFQILAASFPLENRQHNEP